MELRDAIKQRRSRYNIEGTSPLTDYQIEEMLKDAITYIPSAFHSQSSRVILLLEEGHKKLWDIVMETLKEIVPENNFNSTEKKINSFKSAYGTILYYEDMDVVNQMIKDNPLYSDNFPIWSLQSSGMLQYGVWTLLSEAGLGASLQHYNPLIDQKVMDEFNVPNSWKLMAEMPFGKPLSEPDTLDYMPINQRLRVIKKENKI